MDFSLPLDAAYQASRFFKKQIYPNVQGIKILLKKKLRPRQSLENTSLYHVSQNPHSFHPLSIMVLWSL